MTEDAGAVADEDRHHHFFGVLGEAIEAARLGGLRVHVRLEDGRELHGVPEESPLAEGPRDTQVDHTGVRADLVLDDEVIMLTRVTRFAIDRPGWG